MEVKYKGMNKRLQRRILKRVMSAFRTLSFNAVGVIIGVPPTDLEEAEGTRIYSTRNDLDRNRAVLREMNETVSLNNNNGG